MHLQKSLLLYAQHLLPLYRRCGRDASAEHGVIERFRSLNANGPSSYYRTALAAHFTGSALVMDRTAESFLLTFHAKLGKWLQLGGHADGDQNLDQVALREAQEESGISAMTHCRLLFPEGNFAAIPVDLDIHEIPANSREPAHEHFDARYLFLAENRDFAVSSESLALQWFTFAEAFERAGDESLLKLLRKVAILREQGILSQGLVPQRTAPASERLT